MRLRRGLLRNVRAEGDPRPLPDPPGIWVVASADAQCFWHLSIAHEVAVIMKID